MLTVAQRIDILRLSAEIAKLEAATCEAPIADRITQIYEKLKATIEQEGVLGDASIGDVKSAIDVAAEIDDLFE